MEESNENKVLKSRVYLLEKQLYTVIKELDHYRNKCKKLRLKVLKGKNEDLPSKKNQGDGSRSDIFFSKAESAREGANLIVGNRKGDTDTPLPINILDNQGKNTPLRGIQDNSLKSQGKIQNSLENLISESESQKVQSSNSKVKPRQTKKGDSKSPTRDFFPIPPNKSPSPNRTEQIMPPMQCMPSPSPSQLIEPTQSVQPDMDPNLDQFPQKRRAGRPLSDSIKKLKSLAEAEEGEIQEAKSKKVQSKSKMNSVQKLIQSITPKNSQPDPIDQIDYFKILTRSTDPPKGRGKQPDSNQVVNSVTGPNMLNNSIKPLASNPHIGQIDSKQARPALNRKCKPAYNTRYTIEPAFEPSYNTFKSNPVQMTPTTMSLSQVTPIGQKIREAFDVVKRLYQGSYDFAYENVYIISQEFKALEASAAASFLMNEMMQLVYIFSASDALVILYGIIKDLLKKTSWDLEFLKSIRNFFVIKSEDIWFSNANIKLATLGIQVFSIYDVIHAAFTLICKENGYLVLVSKMIGKLVLFKNIRLINKTFEICRENSKDCYSLWIFFRFFVNLENFLKIIQELIESSFSHDENLQMNVYICFKTILRYLQPKDAYEVYAKVLWPAFKDCRDSVVRVMVLRVLPILYLIFEKDQKKKSSEDIKKKMEDVLTDKEFNSIDYLDFTKKEIEVVQRGLMKMGNDLRKIR